MLATAGEHLVCADLLMLGYKAILTSQMCAYDIAVEVDAGRLVRVQVKSASDAKPKGAVYPERERPPESAYQWGIAGGARAMPTRETFDVLALVGLDIRQVAYHAIEDVRSTMLLWTTGPRARPFADFSFADALGTDTGCNCSATFHDD
jgi:hypothetical protein